MNYTREQQLAFTADRHLVISANAGSGKTRILVDRFIQILEKENIPESLQGDTLAPENIIAITFTKKAAGEMFARINKTIGEMIKQEKNPNKSYLLRELRSKIFQAKVSTIHSFCEKLLRDYAVEADVSPNFQILSETDRYFIYKDARINAIESVLSQVSNVEALYFKMFLLRNSFNKIENITDVLFSNLYEYNKIADKFRSEDYNPLKDPENTPYIVSILKKYAKGYECFYTQLEALSENLEIQDKERERVKELKGICSDITNILKNFESAPIETISELIDLVEFTSKIGRSNVLTFILKNSVLSVEEIEILEAIHYLSVKNSHLFENTEAILKFRNIQRAIHYFADELINQINQEKAEKAVFDFDDLMLKVKSMLNDDELRKIMLGNTTHIMVDEFQDTNQLQYDIISDLLPELKGEEDSSSFDRKLFIVGDGKQSIYAFRNADIRVFKKAAETIASINSKKMAEGKLSKDMINFIGERPEWKDKENNGNLSLTASFRLSPVVAAFVNKICGGIMDTGISDFEVDYEDLVFGKNSTAIKQEILSQYPHYKFDEPNQIFQADSTGHGSVNFIIHKEEIEEKEDDTDEVTDNKTNPYKSEAEKLIKYIKSRVEGDNPYQIFEDNTYRPAKYKDVGILFRSRSKTSELVNACIENQVPFVLHSGSGLYKMQEVQDMIALLKFLYDPNDDISCIGVLRSPFFEIQDNELYNISQAAKGTPAISFYQKCKLFAENPLQTEEFKETLEYLEDVLSVSGRLSPSELVNRLIIERKYFEKIGNDKAIAQIKASINKFKATLYDFEEQGYKDIFDLMQQMNTMMKRGKEGEASVSSKDAINLMTIHSSKGLEFPIVALYGANNSSGHNSSVYFSQQFGITFNDKRKDDETNMLVEEPNLIHFLNKEMYKQAEAAEEKRLLYVALTRAKDHLIVSANVSVSKKQEVSLRSFFKSIINVLLRAPGGVAKEAYHRRFYIDAIEEFKIEKQQISFLESNELHNILLGYNVKCIYEVDSPQNNFQNLQQNQDKSKFIDAEWVPARFHNEVFSASKIMAFKTDRNDYEIKYIVGLNTQLNKKQRAENENRSEDELRGNVLGTYIHEAMSLLNAWWKDGGVDEEELKQIIAVMLRRRNSYQESYLQQVYDACLAIVSTDYIRKNREKLASAVFELELNIPLEIHYLTGSIDVLVEEEGGESVIWDWKTNHVNDYADLEELASHYKHQMAIYAYLIYLKNRNQTNYKARLLFTDYANKCRGDEWVYSFEWSNEEMQNLGIDLEETVAELSRRYY